MSKTTNKKKMKRWG